MTAIVKCRDIKCLSKVAEDHTVPDDHLISWGYKISKIRETFSERVPSCETENRTFELRKELNDKKSSDSTATDGFFFLCKDERACYESAPQ